MKPIACLLLGSALALASEVDLAEVAHLMEARERATFPFQVRYRAGEGRSGITATFAADANRRLWRGTVSVPTGRGGFREEEQLWTRYDGAWLFAWHEPDRVLTEWRGEIGEERTFPWPVLPLDFGLEQASELLSRFLTRPSARFAGRETVGKFDCVKVLVDWVHSDTATIQHPLALWLAPAHAYYPVRTVVYALRPGSGLPPVGVLELDGRVFVPREWREVTDLAVLGDARFPLEARVLPRGRGERPVEMHVQLKTLRVGGVPADAFDLPGFLYLKDHRRQGHLWITPLGGIPISWLWIALYLAAACSIGYVIHSLKRRWKERKRDRLKWVDEPPYRSETLKSRRPEDRSPRARGSG